MVGTISAFVDRDKLEKRCCNSANYNRGTKLKKQQMSELKDLFCGYRRKTENEIREIFQNGSIVFDANVFLKLYKYSEETRKAFLQIIQSVSKRIVIPYQVAYEYCKNRYKVIVDQEKAYIEFKKDLEKIKEDIESTIKPPFLSERTENQVRELFKEINNEVESEIKKYSGFLKEDLVYIQLNKLFKDKITSGFSENREKEIVEEGKKRFKDKIPPGYEDEKNKEGHTRYGDLILWMQIIDYAKEYKKDILFITDDSKEDWWWKLKDGRNIGSRPELIEEIKKEAKVNFHMYSSERFIKYAQEFLDKKVDEKALKEIHDIKKAEKEKNLIQRQQQDSLVIEQIIRNINEINQIDEEILDLKQKLAMYKNRTFSLSRKKNKSEEDYNLLDKLQFYISELNNRIEKLNGKLDFLERERMILECDREREIQRFHSFKEFTDESN